jgi:aryl-alcohol dehydrogenase-like predicted oxidoreductase
MISKYESYNTSFPPGVGLGTMMMGWRLDSKESERIISLAYENQVVMIDTSVSYSRGYCHEIIGKALFNLKLRNKFFIATKVGGISNDSDTSDNRGYSKHNIIRQCELSLAQLNIECIDLLQLHNPTKDFELQEILEALDLLMTQGKIKSYGISNYNLEFTREFLSYVSRNNFPKPLTSQFEYNIINFRDNNSLFDFLESMNLRTLTWGPLASGLLTDWYLDKTYLKPNSRIEVGREKSAKNIILNRIATRNILNKISNYCSELNMPAQVFSLLWILKTKPNNSPLIGPSSTIQFMQLIEGVRGMKYKDIDFSSLSL